MIKANDMQVFEILEQVEKAQGRVAKVRTLQQYGGHQPLIYLLMWNFAPHIKSAVPEGMPPIDEEKMMDGPSRASLWNYLKVLPNFVQCPQSAKLKPLQRESLFIEMLQALDPAEAKLVCAVKDKSLSRAYSTITLELVHEALPQLGLSNAAPAPLTKEDVVESAKAELAAAEAELAALQAKIKSLKEQIKPAKAAAQG